MTMKIALAPQFEQMVREKLASGMYASASEVVHDALRLMQEHDQTRVTKHLQLRQDIEDGLSSGPAVHWDADDITRAGYARRAVRAENGA
ncbi:type II toxin-antitoxin system ParD family antitoxin [Massilia sp. CCM 8694]|uniref:Type II toxin-antitoxin system ParD family antitoxin n=2 Tax=Massilia genomosp. 1 TaxID=2609280 RepID=A0ABX0MT88_9BURK|nr:type II toxin-antitoxin system ParD family antitoxin [Massilia genomosp. 1]